MNISEGELKGKFRLQGYYYRVQFSGIIVLSIILILVKIFSAEDLFSVNTRLFNILAISMLAVHAALFLFCEILKLKIFYDISRYAWVFFWLALIYNSGGIASQLIFFLVFPILVSAADLEEKDTKIMGIILTLGLGLMLFGVPIQSLSKGLVARHLVITSIYAVIAYYTHNIVKDTLRHRYGKEIAERRFKELREFDNLKEDFLKVAQHQLRTPLSGVRWALQNLQKSPSLRPDELKLVTNSSEKVDDAMNIVSEMLKTAEVDVKSLIIKKDSIDVGSLVKSILEELRYLSDKNKVSVEVKTPLDLLIKGDNRLIYNALTNVLDNAIRYSPNGKVNIDVAEQNHDVEIIIKDSGIGISEEDLPFIFERLYRGKDAISLDPNESGIGLYVAKKIVELHNGTISIFSKKDVGTTIKILLPRFIS